MFNPHEARPPLSPLAKSMLASTCCLLPAVSHALLLSITQPQSYKMCSTCSFAVSLADMVHLLVC